MTVTITKQIENGFMNLNEFMSLIKETDTFNSYCFSSDLMNTCLYYHTVKVSFNSKYDRFDITGENNFHSTIRIRDFHEAHICYPHKDTRQQLHIFEKRRSQI
jgi:hypothetical protein